MLIPLTSEQLQALHAQIEPRVIDPATNEVFVLVSLDQYERLKAALANEDQIKELELVLAQLTPEDWEDAANYEGEI